MSASVNEFDVVVVGGGPGGSAAASFLAMEGARVLLLERYAFPRYRYGESLNVSTVQGICRALGVAEAVDRAGFVRKPGALFRWGESPDLWNIAFTQARQLQARDANYAYHVERAVFDKILLAAARHKGVLVMEGATVKEAEMAGDRVSGVVYRTRHGDEARARAHFVLDASGASSRLYSLVGERAYSRFFRNMAVFGYYENASRLPHPFEGGGLSEAFSGGWMWFLPLSQRLTSVGAVIGADLPSSGDDDARLARFKQCIGECPNVRRLLGPAVRCDSAMYGPIRIRSDWSYTNQRFWRPGLVLVGDAACFLDPLLSTGVHLATYAGLLAARSITSVLKGEVDEELAFEEFEVRYRLEYELFYNFVVAYYDMHCDVGSPFWSARKVEVSPELQNDAFVKLLTGGRDDPATYFGPKRGIGLRVQAYAHRLGLAVPEAERVAVSRAMAEEVHNAFPPESGPRPFHLGLEDLRVMTWGRDECPRSDVDSAAGRPLKPSASGLSWQRSEVSAT